MPCSTAGDVCMGEKRKREGERGKSPVGVE